MWIRDVRHPESFGFASTSHIAALPAVPNTDQTKDAKSLRSISVRPTEKRFSLGIWSRWERMQLMKTNS